MRLESTRKPQAAAPELGALFTCVCSGVLLLGALAWPDAGKSLPEPDSGTGRSPSASFGPDPTLRTFFSFLSFLHAVTKFIEVASELWFYSCISSSPVLCPLLFPSLAVH